MAEQMCPFVESGIGAHLLNRASGALRELDCPPGPYEARFVHPSGQPSRP